ncbi:hypothetical protein MKX03_018330 [Papaver bracteatum]|nr:hypothetical protein MKX03_018330 [Papaver bracteatum]
MAASKSQSLKEYIKNMKIPNEVEKKKKKKIKMPKKDPMGVLVVDKDPVKFDYFVHMIRFPRMEVVGYLSLIEKDLSSNNTNLDASTSRERTTRYDTPSPEAEVNPSNSENQDVDLSPPCQKRRRVRKPSPEGKVKLNEYGNKDPDLSPPRQRHLSPPRESRTDHLHSDSIDLSPPRRTRSRSKSAVNSLVIKKMDPSVSGRAPEHIYRDKGRFLSKEEVLHDMSLIRVTMDDPQVDNMLKEGSGGAPNATLGEDGLGKFGDNEKMKESGWIERKIDPIPNRYCSKTNVLGPKGPLSEKAKCTSQFGFWAYA